MIQTATMLDTDITLPLDAILDTAFVGIAFTRERRFVQANPAMERMFGWARGSLVGQPGLPGSSVDSATSPVGRHQSQLQK